jgi:hypothetical protein
MEAALLFLGGTLGAAITAGPAWVQLHRKLGNPNGSGSIAEMVELTLVRVGQMQSDLQAHLTDQAIHRRGVEAAVWYDAATDGVEDDD